MKKAVQIIMAVILVGILSACTTNTDDGDNKEITPITLTIEELRAYDGLNGAKAYIAVDGIIYDVTNDVYWQNGGHNGFQAGQDLTDEIKNSSPHGVSMLDRVPIVGEIVDGEIGGDPIVEDPPVPTTMYLTITELKMYNGSTDTKAYIAVDGIIYDVTNEADWAGGMHNGLTAGNDLTVEIKSSPHGLSVLEGLNGIGELVIDHIGDGPYEPYLYLTASELLQFDGSGDNKGYIAVNTVIYDVTDESRWSDGTHEGFSAGMDLTGSFENESPHDDSIFSGLVIVGELVED